MAKTIGTLAYQIVADTGKFTQGIVATKKELRAITQIVEATQTPLERFNAQMEGLNILKGKGLGDSAFANAASQIRKEFDDATDAMNPFSTAAGKATISGRELFGEFSNGVPVLGQFNNAMNFAHPALLAAAAAGGGLVIAYKAISAAVSFATEKISEQFQVLDDMISSAQKLDVSVAVYQDIAKAAELADVKMEGVDKALETMLVSVAKADKAEFGQLFKQLGLDAAELERQAPDQMLRSILSALEELPSAADRARIAKTIFGDADILRVGIAGLDSANAALEEIGAHLTDLDVSRLDQMDAAWVDMRQTLDDVFKKVAVELAPAFEDVAVLVKDILVDAAKDGSLASAITTSTDALRGMVMVMRELATIIQSIASDPKINALAGLAGGGLLPAAQVGTGAFADLGSALRESDKLDQVFRDRANAAAKEEDKAISDEQSLFASRFAMSMFGAGTGGAGQFDFGETQVQKMTKALEEQLLALRMGAEAFQLYKASAAGATAEERARLEELQKGIKAQQEANKLHTEAKAAVESLKSPHEQARDKIARYYDMLEAADINHQQFEALRDRTINEFRNNRRDEQFRNPALVRGSQESLQAINNARFGQQNVWDQMAESLRNIEDKIGEQDPLEVPVINGFG